MCTYQATQQGDLTKHKQFKHEGLKYDCDLCTYRVTKQGDITKHKQSKHEGEMYPPLLIFL